MGEDYESGKTPAVWVQTIFYCLSASHVANMARVAFQKEIGIIC